MKVKGIITETLVVQKEVELEVPYWYTKEEIHQEVRNLAYQKTIMDHYDEHGWEGIDTLYVHVHADYERER